MVFVHEGYKGKYGSYFPLHVKYTTLSTVFIVEVTVNTCTCSDVFTVITTKDQSGGIYNSCSTGGQGFMAVVNKPRPQTMPSEPVCLLP